MQLMWTLRPPREQPHSGIFSKLEIFLTAFALLGPSAYSGLLRGDFGTQSLVRGHSTIRVTNWNFPDYDFTVLCSLDLVILFGFRAFGLVIQDKSVFKLFIHSFKRTSMRLSGDVVNFFTHKRSQPQCEAGIRDRAKQSKFSTLAGLLYAKSGHMISKMYIFHFLRKHLVNLIKWYITMQNLLMRYLV